MLIATRCSSACYQFAGQYQSGSGLGLAIVREIARRRGASMDWSVLQTWAARGLRCVFG